MEQSGESHQHKRIRISWKDHNIVKTFLEACILEVGMNGKGGSSLKALSWKKVAETLKNTHNFVVDRNQMRNHFDYLKWKYGAWLKLKNKTDNVYDPSTNTFNLTPEEWDLEIETNKVACPRVWEAMVHHQKTLCQPPSLFVVIDTETNTSNDQPHMSSTPCTSRAPVEKAKGKKSTKPTSELDEKLIHFLDSMSSRYGNPELVSYDSCLKKLNDLGWERDDPLYRIALSLLTDTRNREAWMTIPGEIAKDWVKTKMAMFLTMVGHNERYRVIKRRFQHSTRTVHICFHEVLLGMMEFAREIVVPTTSDTTSNMSNNQRRLREIFPGAIGALDGTLIHAIVPASHQTAFRGRGGGRCYQNVLGICDFNMIFTFIWAGWEGIAHDSRILKEVAYNPRTGFPLPPEAINTIFVTPHTLMLGDFWLHIVTQDRLADFRRRHALTKEEKFNHAHAQLRNVIERAYGVLKVRFPILKQMAPFPFTTQRNVVIACVAIYNFIRKYNIQDQLFMECNEDTIFNNEEEVEGSGEEELDISQWGANSTQYMGALRDEIANSLINDV
ncbi:hypothetical protein OROGR_008526 [Orobanche gracilis]